MHIFQDVSVHWNTSAHMCLLQGAVNLVDFVEKITAFGECFFTRVLVARLLCHIQMRRIIELLLKGLMAAHLSKCHFTIFMFY